MPTRTSQKRPTNTDRVDRFLGVIKHHKVVAIVLFIGVAIVALGKFTDSLTQLTDFAESFYHAPGRTIVAREHGPSGPVMHWSVDKDDPSIRDIRPIHVGRFGKALSDFWAAAALRNDTERTICFSLWRDNSDEWRLFVLKPHERKTFVVRYDLIHVKIDGDVVSYRRPARLAATNSDADVYSLDCDMFDHEPTVPEQDNLEPNVFKEIYGADPIHLYGSQTFRAMIVGRKNVQLHKCNCDADSKEDIAVLDADVPVITDR